MDKRSDAGASGWVDPADAPELTDEFFDRAEIRDGETVVRRGRGRPKSVEPREQIALRVEQAILQRYRDTGPGWQTRMNTALTMARENLLAVGELKKAILYIEKGEIVCREGPERRDVSTSHIEQIKRWIADYERANETLTGLVEDRAQEFEKE